MRTLRLFVLCGFLLLFCKLALATVIGVPADYSTIQMAIDSSSTGDTVLVQPGTYTENINFNGHNIVLGSLFLTTGDTVYISTTIIDGGSSGPVITIGSGEDSTAVITGFTIQNGSASRGGGIRIHDYSDPTISHNIIIGNSSTQDGGGVAVLVFSDPFIGHNIIVDNSSIEDGGGIFCWNSSPTIIGNTVIGNSSGTDGGGIQCLNASPPVTNTIVWGNTAVGSGPGINLYSGTPIITYCDVQDTLWPGTGNISCDPMFCDTASGNYYLADTSCCVGAGQGGVDIGALGVGCGLMTIPTLNEWGMLIMGLLLLTAGTVAVIRRKKAAINNTA